MSFGLTPVPAGHVAAIVTYLEMNARPALEPEPDSPLRLRRWETIDPARYRDLFRRVGGRWLWFSRLGARDRAGDGPHLLARPSGGLALLSQGRLRRRGPGVRKLSRSAPRGASAARCRASAAAGRIAYSNTAAGTWGASAR